MPQTAPAPRRAGLTRRAGQLALALGALALALLLAEVGVRATALAPAVRPIRVTGGQTVYQRSANPVLGFELKPNWRDPDADLFESLPSTNSHGLRDRERTHAKPAGVRRVLLLGDSVVEGAGLRRLGDTLAGQLERHFADGKTEVLNFGVSGYCTRAEVELLETKGLAFAPDVVLLVFVLNDFDNFNPEAWELQRTPRPALVETLFTSSHLFRVTALRLNLFQFGADADPVRRNKVAIGDNNVVVGLRRLAELSTRHGFEVRVAVWPLLERASVVDPHPMPGGSGELVIERLARAHGFATLRLSDAFRAHARAAGKAVSPRARYSQGDRVHPSPEGARVAAAALARFVDQATPVEATGPDAAAEAAAATLGGNRPDYARVHYNAARKLQFEGKLAPAVEAYRRALAGATDDTAGAVARRSDSHNNLGLALTSLQRYGEAEQSFRRALELTPGDPKVHVNLAGLHMAQGHPAKAAASLKEAVRLAPDLLVARRRLAMLLGRSGDVAGAVVQLRAIIARAPGDAQAHGLLGGALASRGDLVAAMPHLVKQAQLRPNDPRALTNLGAAYAASGQPQRALGPLRRSLQLKPSADAYTNLHLALTQLGRRAEAARALAQAKALDTASTR